MALRTGARSGREIKEELDKGTGMVGVTFETLNFTEKGIIDAGPEVFVIRTVRDGKFVEAQ